MLEFDRSVPNPNSRYHKELNFYTAENIRAYRRGIESEEFAAKTIRRIPGVTSVVICQRNGTDDIKHRDLIASIEGGGDVGIQVVSGKRGARKFRREIAVMLKNMDPLLTPLEWMSKNRLILINARQEEDIVIKSFLEQLKEIIKIGDQLPAIE